MENRKLYHLVNGEFVLCGMPSVHIPTYAEIGAHIAILNDVGFFDDHSVAEPVCFDGISDGKRNTEKQASLYDAMMAEIMDERNAEKARVRNRRHADRKYKLTPKMRKEQEYMRNWNVCMKMVNFGTWDDIPIVEGRVRSAEQIARKDYEIELRNIADDAERDAIDAEIREWERKHAVEQANARAWMAMQNWLEWA